MSIASDGLEKYIDKHDIQFPVCSDLSRSVAKELGLTSTPQTLVISREGIVLKYWRGAFIGRFADEIEEFFEVELPGLINQAANSRTLAEAVE